MSGLKLSIPLMSPMHPDLKQIVRVLVASVKLFDDAEDRAGCPGSTSAGALAARLGFYKQRLGLVPAQDGQSGRIYPADLDFAPSCHVAFPAFLVLVEVSPTRKIFMQETQSFIFYRAADFDGLYGITQRLSL